MKQERDWPSLDLQMSKTKNKKQTNKQTKTKNGSKVKESENTLKAKSHKEMFSMSLLERTSATLTLI